MKTKLHKFKVQTCKKSARYPRYYGGKIIEAVNLDAAIAQANIDLQKESGKKKITPPVNITWYRVFSDREITTKEFEQFYDGCKHCVRVSLVNPEDLMTNEQLFAHKAKLAGIEWRIANKTPLDLTRKADQEFVITRRDMLLGSYNRFKGLSETLMTINMVVASTWLTRDEIKDILQANNVDYTELEREKPALPVTGYGVFANGNTLQLHVLYADEMMDEVHGLVESKEIVDEVWQELYPQVEPLDLVELCS